MHDHEKEPIGHALHVLDTTMRRYIDTYSHKKEHENLTGTNTWVIQFIADHKDGPVYLRDIERRFGITRSTASKWWICLCETVLWSATPAKRTPACVV